MPGNSLADIQKMTRHRFNVANPVAEADKVEIEETLDELVEEALEEASKPKRAKKAKAEAE